MRLLVTGFGPFGAVIDNPAAHLARALNGRTIAGCTVNGHEIPVSYLQGVRQTVQLARGADAVLGIGVATDRTAPMLERFAHKRASDRPDIDGRCSPEWIEEDPQRVESSLDVQRWAESLGCAISENAGWYVCNAWLYQVTQHLDVPVGFLHVPSGGVELDWLIAGLRVRMTPPSPHVG